MPSAEPFPLYFPRDAPRAFGDEELRRRIARSLRLDETSRVLDLGSEDGGALLAAEFDCKVTAGVADQAMVQVLRQKVKGGGSVEVKKVDFGALPFGDAAFDVVLALGRVPMS